jgi:hypothetical protein
MAAGVLSSTRAGLRPFLSSNLDLPALLAELARLASICREEGARVAVKRVDAAVITP